MQMEGQLAAGKLRIHEVTVFFVEKALSYLWSPKQASAIDDTIDRSVSHKWIYLNVATDKNFGGGAYDKGSGV